MLKEGEIVLEFQPDIFVRHDEIEGLIDDLIDHHMKTNHYVEEDELEREMERYADDNCLISKDGLEEALNDYVGKDDLPDAVEEAVRDVLESSDFVEEAASGAARGAMKDLLQYEKTLQAKVDELTAQFDALKARRLSFGERLIALFTGRIVQ